MDLGTISSRYARALFSLAMEKKEETRVYDDMKMLKESFLLFPELKETLQNPIVSVADKEKLLIHAGGIEVCDLYRKFIHMVLSHKRESCLPLIVYFFIYLYQMWIYPVDKTRKNEFGYSAVDLQKAKKSNEGAVVKHRAKTDLLAF